MKYAIFESGGKQYKAEEGETLSVDLLHLEAGKKIELKDVLLLVDGKKVTIGLPIVAGAMVKATVVEEYKARKIIVFKYKPRQRYRVKQGHRQKYTRLLIDEIESKSAAKKTEAAPKTEDKPKAEAKPKAEDKPKVEAKPKAEDKPKAEAKPKTEAKPKAEAKPKTKAKTKAKTAPKKEPKED